MNNNNNVFLIFFIRTFLFRKQCGCSCKIKNVICRIVVAAAKLEQVGFIIPWPSHVKWNRR